MKSPQTVTFHSAELNYEWVFPKNWLRVYSTDYACLLHSSDSCFDSIDSTDSDSIESFDSWLDSIDSADSDSIKSFDSGLDSIDSANYNYIFFVLLILSIISMVS